MEEKHKQATAGKLPNNDANKFANKKNKMM
jgi:hypothetical protein